MFLAFTEYSFKIFAQFFKLQLCVSEAVTSEGTYFLSEAL